MATTREADECRCSSSRTAPIASATILVRDSKRPHGPRLAVTRTAWTGFVGAAVALES
ncbi:DUF397 domain-containing protein [Streptomyces sp. NPDC003781]|uniref:DUF397 domain-containing protein n=1 Tax=Streptomyces sp. NPDC003781 TaxID=3364686 RepID=UPI00368CB2D4